MANLMKPSASFIRPFINDFLDTDAFFKHNEGQWMQVKFPAINIAENDKEFMIELAVPGFKKEDFSVHVDDDVMTISAEKKEAHESTEKNYTRKEYLHESFRRSFRLPENVKDDQVQALYEDGLLKLTLPKSEMQVKTSKQIKVS